MSDEYLTRLQRKRLAWGQFCDYRNDSGHTSMFDAYLEAMADFSTNDTKHLANGVRQTSIRGWSGNWARKWTRGQSDDGH